MSRATGRAKIKSNNNSSNLETCNVCIHCKKQFNIKFSKFASEINKQLDIAYCPECMLNHAFELKKQHLALEKEYRKSETLRLENERNERIKVENERIEVENEKNELGKRETYYALINEPKSFTDKFYELNQIVLGLKNQIHLLEEKSHDICDCECDCNRNRY